MKNKQKIKLSSLPREFLAYEIASQLLDIQLKGVIIPMIKKEQREIRNLSKRGIALIEIIDKGLETTYHLKEGVEEMLNAFVKKNNKWKWEKEKSFGIKTGRYILTRNYRKYHKQEKDICPTCGREY